jgi:glycosyltransferase involved in cell wall biosynthesis
LKISIALCTYNGARFLQEQLESIAGQTLLPDELIVCDDCSTDDTVSILKRFSACSRFPVHLFINDQNLGSTQNFERAIKLCSGDIIFLSDQDDVWMPEKLSVIESTFRSNRDVGLVFTNAILVDETLKPLDCFLWDRTFPASDRKLFEEKCAIDVLIKYNVVTGATMAFRSSLRNAFLPIQTFHNLIHDGWIALLIATTAQLKPLEEPLIKYRLHPHQQIGVPRITEQSYEMGDRRNNETGGKRNYEEAIRHLSLDLLEIGELRKRLEMVIHHSEVSKLERTRTVLSLIERREIYIRELIGHYDARLNLPAARFKRLKPVIRELMTGRYNRYSRGIASALKDLWLGR